MTRSSCGRFFELRRDSRGHVCVADAVKAVTANAETRANRLPAAHIRARARGSVAWNAVSNTATCGTLANNSRAPRIAWIAGGLCSGARRSSVVRVAPALQSSMSVGAVKRSPPCTTRWATASILPSSVQRLRNSVQTQRRSRPRSPASGPSLRRVCADDELRILAADISRRAARTSWRRCRCRSPRI